MSRRVGSAHHPGPKTVGRAHPTKTENPTLTAFTMSLLTLILGIGPSAFCAGDTAAPIQPADYAAMMELLRDTDRRAPAEAVSFADLWSNPLKYEGRRVRIGGRIDAGSASRRSETSPRSSRTGSSATITTRSASSTSPSWCEAGSAIGSSLPGRFSAWYDIGRATAIGWHL